MLTLDKASGVSAGFSMQGSVPAVCFKEHKTSGQKAGALQMRQANGAPGLRLLFSRSLSGNKTAGKELRMCAHANK